MQCPAFGEVERVTGIEPALSAWEAIWCHHENCCVTTTFRCQSVAVPDFVPYRRGTRARFGSIRQLPSGRWQARYKAPDGATYNAPVTFPTKSDARAFLTTVETDIIRRVWRAPTSTGAPTDRIA